MNRSATRTEAKDIASIGKRVKIGEKRVPGGQGTPSLRFAYPGTNSKIKLLKNPFRSLWKVLFWVVSGPEGPRPDSKSIVRRLTFRANIIDDTFGLN